MTISTPNYSIRFSSDDKACLRELARRLQQTQANTVRLLVRESLKALQEQDTAKQKAKPTRRTSRPAN